MIYIVSLIIWLSLGLFGVWAGYLWIDILCVISGPIGVIGVMAGLGPLQLFEDDDSFTKRIKRIWGNWFNKDIDTPNPIE